MIRYLLDFKTMTDVAVRTAILSLALALLAAGANQFVFAYFLPDLQSQTAGVAFFGAFSITLALSAPVMLVFFAAGLEINHLNGKLAALADMDHLTGLTNRRKFFHEISVKRAETGEAVMRQRGSLLIVDIDHFKSINDGHGHQAGDEALIHIAKVLKSCVRDLDIVSRLGGEEFGVMLLEADKKIAQEIAERIRRTINSSPVTIATGQATLSVSIGGSEVWPLQSLAECMRRTDLLLYAAKSAGRNRVQFSEPLRIPSYPASVSPEPRMRVNARD
jgi:diguanylate cyclase (GGDEF)-like protein